MLSKRTDILHYNLFTQLAASLKARAVSHLDEVSPAGVASLTASRTAAVLLPTTTLLLRRYPPPATAISQAGVPVALGTDFKASQYCTSMVREVFLAIAHLDASYWNDEVA